jgi:hypothetical protein
MSIFERDDAGVDPEVEIIVASITISSVSREESISE